MLYSSLPLCWGFPLISRVLGPPFVPFPLLVPKHESFSPFLHKSPLLLTQISPSPPSHRFFRSFILSFPHSFSPPMWLQHGLERAGSRTICKHCFWGILSLCSVGRPGNAHSVLSSAKMRRADTFDCRKEKGLKNACYGKSNRHGMHFRAPRGAFFF